MYVCYEDIRSSGLELHRDSCELPHELWEMNPGPLEEQSGLVTTESSCQSVFLQKKDHAQNWAPHDCGKNEWDGDSEL